MRNRIPLWGAQRGTHTGNAGNGRPGTVAPTAECARIARITLTYNPRYVKQKEAPLALRVLSAQSRAQKGPSETTDKKMRF